MNAPAAPHDGDVRSAFEHWYSDAGQWPQAVERDGAGYGLMNTQLAWAAWQAACNCYQNNSCHHRPGKGQEPI